MSNRKFHLQIVIRIFAIFGMGGLAVYVLVRTEYWLIFCWLFLFSVLALYSLLRYINKYNRDLGNFLIAIKQHDFSNVYPENFKQSNLLFHAFNVINEEFSKLRKREESNYHFFKTIACKKPGHVVEVGLAAVNEAGVITLSQ